MKGSDRIARVGAVIGAFFDVLTVDDTPMAGLENRVVDIGVSTG